MTHTILIVEDELTLLRALERKFMREGFTVVIAKDGVEGLEKFKEHRPDVLLVDIIMPRMDGITLLGKIREEPYGETLPAILLTNLSDAQKVDEGLRHGVRDYLVKSDWRLEDLVKKVKEKLEM